MKAISLHLNFLRRMIFIHRGRFVTYGTGQSFLFEPYDFGFRDQDMPPLPDGKYIGIGASKGVKLIEGPSGPGGIHAALVMDGMISIFLVLCIPVDHL